MRVTRHTPKTLPTQAPKGLGYLYAFECPQGVFKVGATSGPKLRVYTHFTEIRKWADYQPPKTILLSVAHQNYQQNEKAIQSHFGAKASDLERYSASEDEVLRIFSSLEYLGAQEDKEPFRLTKVPLRRDLVDDAFEAAALWSLSHPHQKITIAGILAMGIEALRCETKQARKEQAA